MHPAQALLRPLSRRIMPGTAGRYIHSSTRFSRRNTNALKDHVYFAKATAEGPSRNELVKSNGDAPLELMMSMPRIAGVKGDGQNPEQLFAMGYSSSSAPCIVAARTGKPKLAEMAKVHTSVYLGHPIDANTDGFGLRVQINVEGCDDDEVIIAAHEFCPYSRALQHGVDVKITKT